MSKEINSGKTTPVKSPARAMPKSLEPAEIARVSEERRAQRIARARRELPPSALKVIDACPASYQDRLIKALLGLSSPKVAVRAHCEQCVGWEDVKTRVGDCRSHACPLHHYRPHQEGRK